MSTPSVRTAPPLWLLVLVTFSGTLAMDMFVPALPNAAADLNASPAAIRMTISLYILGLAFGQLIYGPLSDCLGRRPTLMAGLLLYTASGLVAALAPDINVLIAARLAQALGGCAGLLLGRAIVQDIAGSAEAMGKLALMNLMTMIGPGLAPLLGGAVTENLGWRAVFVILCALGIFNMVFVWRLLPETGRPSGRMSVVSIGSDYKSLVGSRIFLGYAVGGACATTSLYAFIADAPFIFVHQLHRPLHEVGIYLGMLIVGMSLGNALAHRVAGKIATERLLVAANAVNMLCAFSLLSAVLLGSFSAPLTGALMFVYTFGAGACGPAVLAKTISVDPRITGSAAGLFGFIQMAVGAVCTSLSGLGTNPALAATCILSVAGVIGQVAFWIASRNEEVSGQLRETQ